jgi:hypothetical protein
MKRSVGCILAVLAAACATSGKSAPAAAPFDRDEAAIYTLVIDSVLETAGDPFVVVAESTRVVGLEPEELAGWMSRADSTFSAAVADFAVRNHTPIVLPRQTLSGRTIRHLRLGSFVPERDRDDQHDYVLRGHEPVRWLHALSRPGFDAERRHAVMTTASGCGGFCADTRLVLLVRDARGWHVQRWKVMMEG